MSENKTEYTPTEALKCLDGISKNALYNDMKGNLSFTEKDWGKRKQRIIQGAELARVYGDKFKPLNNTGTTQENETGQPKTTQQDKKTAHVNNTLQVEVEVLREKVKFRDQTISDKDELITDLKQERDEWKDQAKTLLLKGPDLPVQAMNDNSGRGVGETPKKAVRGKNFAVFGAAVVAVIVVLFLGVIFGPEIQSQLNGVGGFNSIAPAAGR